MRIHILGPSLLLVALFSTGLVRPAMAQSCTMPDTVTTIAGTPNSPGFDDGTGAAARFTRPSGAAVDGGGNLYVMTAGATHEYSPSVRKITREGVVTTLAGDPQALAGLRNGQGMAARFSAGARQLAADPAGNLYIADTTTVRKVSPLGEVTRVAGLQDYQGPALDAAVKSARFVSLKNIAVSGDRTLYVTDAHTVRRVVLGAMVSTVAGGASAGFVDGTGSVAQFKSPQGLVVVGNDIFVADTGNHAIRRINSAGEVKTIAGGKGAGNQDGQGAAAKFLNPTSLTLAADGSLYVADLNRTIRRIDDPTGSAVVTTIVGADAPMAEQKLAARPQDLSGRSRDLAIGRDASGGGVLYFSELASSTVRKVGCLSKAGAYLANASFERPVMPSRGYLYNPTNGSWTFTGGAGVQINGSAWGAANAVDGVQTAFLQNPGALIAQTFNVAAGSYTVSFHAARRAGQTQPISVAIDGMPLGKPVTPAGDAFTLYTLPAVSLSAGFHTLEFRAAGIGPDNSSFIDAVQLRMSEPAGRHGMTFGLSPESTQAPGHVEASCHALPAPLDNPHRGSCNPYAGDTACSAALPVLCFDPATGVLAATPNPVVGSSIGNRVAGQEECNAQGLAGRMASFHDGGGWLIRALRGENLVPGTRYWVHIGDQPGNCWDR